jgi:hypothetical protein
MSDTTDLVRRLHESATAPGGWVIMAEAADMIERLSAPAAPTILERAFDQMIAPAAPAPDADTVDQIMALADQYASECMMDPDGGKKDGDIARDAIRAAVERVIAQERKRGDTAMEEVTRTEAQLMRAEAERDALKELLREAREEVAFHVNRGSVKDEGLLDRIDAALHAPDA